MSQASVMQQFASVLNLSSAGASYGAHMELLRFIATPCLIWVSHAVNFLLPFYILLPLQLYTVAISSRVVRATACALAAQHPAILAAAGGVCRTLRLCMKLAVILLCMPAVPQPAEEGPQQDRCDDVQGLLQVVGYTYVVVLLVLPCLVGYMVEMTLKLNWLKGQQQRAREQRAARSSSSSNSSQSSDSATDSNTSKVPWLAQSNLARLMLAYTSLVVGWFGCGAVVAMMPDVTCIP
jgi:hypothetical protein